MAKSKPELPRDGDDIPVQVTPALAALTTTYDASISGSTEITLNTSAVLIGVAARDKTI